VYGTFHEFCPSIEELHTPLHLYFAVTVRALGSEMGEWRSVSWEVFLIQLHWLVSCIKWCITFCICCGV
jgi:hypothetical protein